MEKWVRGKMKRERGREWRGGGGKMKKERERE